LTVQDAYRLLIGRKVKGKLKVRRHTLLECERLQGFPDFWTSIAKDKDAFKMLGNAVTTSVVSFVARQVKTKILGKL
jgi:DNA (cytosine-5)-methyltransferase 1